MNENVVLSDWNVKYKDCFWNNVELARCSLSISGTKLSKLLGKPDTYYVGAYRNRHALKLSNAVGLCAAVGLTVEESFNCSILDYFTDTAVGKLYTDTVRRVNSGSIFSKRECLFDRLKNKAMLPSFISIPRFNPYRDIIQDCIFMPLSSLEELFTRLVKTTGKKMDYVVIDDFTTDDSHTITLEESGRKVCFFKDWGTVRDYITIHSPEYYHLYDEDCDFNSMINKQEDINYQKEFFNSLFDLTDNKTDFNRTKFSDYIGMDPYQLQKYLNFAYGGPELKDNQKNELRLDNAIKMCSKFGVSIGSAFSLMYSNKELSDIEDDDPFFWIKLSWNYNCFSILEMIALLLDERTPDELPMIRNSYQKDLR